MAQTVGFCLERAEEAAREARGATLDNVRERARRSEVAWREMADRAIKIEENRARRTEERADANDRMTANDPAAALGEG